MWSFEQPPSPSFVHVVCTRPKKAKFWWKYLAILFWVWRNNLTTKLKQPFFQNGLKTYVLATINRKFEIFITFLQPGMKTFKDSKDLISSCHHHHHLSEKVSLFSSNNEHLSKYVMIFLQSIYDKNFLHEGTIYHRKKQRVIFRIVRNTCSNTTRVPSLLLAAAATSISYAQNCFISYNFWNS